MSSEGCRQNKLLYPEEYRKFIYYFNSRENTFTVLNDLVYENRTGLYDSFDYIIRCDTTALPLKNFEEFYVDLGHNYSIWKNQEATPVSLVPTVVQTKNRFISAAEDDVLNEYNITDYLYTADVEKPEVEANIFFDIYDNVGESVSLEDTKINPEEGYYINRNYPDLRYRLEENSISLFIESSVRVYPEESPTKEVFSGVIESNSLVVNSVTIPLRQGEHKLASLNKEVTVEVDNSRIEVPAELVETNSKITTENNPFKPTISDYYTLRVEDPRLGFEKGLWNEQVGNCFNYDDNPQIEMALNTEVVREGDSSLLLSAQRHNACTDISFSVEPEDVIDLTIPYYTRNPERFCLSIKL